MKKWQTLTVFLSYKATMNLVKGIDIVCYDEQ